MLETEEYVAKIAELKFENINSCLKLGEILFEAKKNLSKKEFKRLLEDPKVNYKRTQAEKFIMFYCYVSKCQEKCQSTDKLIELGIEKVCILSAVDDEEQQEQLQDYALNSAISVSEMKKVVAKMKENAELTPSVALEEVRKEKEEVRKEKAYAKANKKQEDSSDNQGLKAENKALKARVTALEETVAKLTAELQQQQIQKKPAKISKHAEVVGMKATKQRSLIDLGKQFVSMASAS